MDSLKDLLAFFWLFGFVSSPWFLFPFIVVSVLKSAMEEELQELGDLVAQLRADNERLGQEQAPVATSGPSTVASIVTTAPSVQQLVGASAPLTERFVFVS